MIPRTFAGLLALAGLTAACSEPATAPATPGSEAAIVISASTTGTTIATLVVEVSAADIPVPLVFNLPVDPATGVAAGTVRVPPGEARTFAITAFEAGGEITHEGAATLTVRPGVNPPVNIVLAPRAGQVPVSVSFGSFVVVVTPSTAELDFTGTATVQLTVEVYDHEGAPVADLTGLQWATSAPAVAGVDATGFVTALLPGGASIVATFEGVAGVCAITVVDGGPVDLDGDGFTSDVDCDDSDATVYPGAPELIDGQDNDCDGMVDE